MKVEELAQAEKEQRKQRIKTRLLYVLVEITSSAGIGEV